MFPLVNCSILYLASSSDYWFYRCFTWMGAIFSLVLCLCLKLHPHWGGRAPVCDGSAVVCWRGKLGTFLIKSQPARKIAWLIWHVMRPFTFINDIEVDLFQHWECKLLKSIDIDSNHDHDTDATPEHVRCVHNDLTRPHQCSVGKHHWCGKHGHEHRPYC